MRQMHHSPTSFKGQLHSFYRAQNVITASCLFSVVSGNSTLLTLWAKNSGLYSSMIMNYDNLFGIGFIMHLKFGCGDNFCELGCEKVFSALVQMFLFGWRWL